MVVWLFFDIHLIECYFFSPFSWGVDFIVLLKSLDIFHFRVITIMKFSSIDLLYAASIIDKRRPGEPKRLLLKSFCESFARICNHPTLLGNLPTCNRPINGEGISIDLTEKEKFLAFSTSTVKLLSKCLTEGTLYLEGLLDSSCVLSVCKLLCFGDDDVHMVNIFSAVSLD